VSRYHGKCLKIARGKVKEDDKYTCPICDWRVKIPRDAARPTLESLVSWHEEIPALPFQPEEEEVLKRIIDNAQDFRTHISSYCNPILATASEAETQRFYLRKIEGAEILLAYETNYFRQELHKWSPVAPEPPPLIEDSKSTRKPRPTKLQKLLHQYGVEDPDDLPDPVRHRANHLRRKAMNAEAAAEAAAEKRAQAKIVTGTSPGAYQAYFGRTSSQPETPGLSITSSTHAHPSRGPDSASSSHGHGRNHGRSESGSASRDAMDIDGNFFMQDGVGNGPQILVDSALSVEDQLLLDLEAGNMDKDQILEHLSRTNSGRKKAEEIFGSGVWQSGFGGSGANEVGGAGGGPAQHAEDNDGDVDRMFTDLLNQDDDEEGSPNGKRIRDADKQVTAEDLESERNQLDIMLDMD